MATTSRTASGLCCRSAAPRASDAAHHLRTAVHRGHACAASPVPTVPKGQIEPSREIMTTEPSARRGWLRNGNPPGDPATAPRCGARTRAQTDCASPAMANGRCRMHGGSSTGPRTPEGMERCRRTRWKHGQYSSAVDREYRRLKAECQAFNVASALRHAAVFAGMRRLLREQRRELVNLKRRARRRRARCSG